MEEINTDLMEGYLGKISTWVIEFTPRLIAGILVLFIGLWIAKRIGHVLDRVIERSQIDLEIGGFIKSLSHIALKLVVFLSAAAVIGFEVSSLIGVLAGVVFAVGLALQGFLGNFAAGMTIVFFKPFAVGDWIAVDDMFGKVDNIQIFNTIMTTPNNKTLIIPNGQITDNTITNYSRRGSMRLELTIAMPYAEDLTKVKRVIQEALADYPLISHDPAPMIGIEGFDSHYINITVRPLIDPDHYWEATFDCHARIKNAFHKAGIQMAYSEGVELGPIGA